MITINGEPVLSPTRELQTYLSTWLPGSVGGGFWPREINVWRSPVGAGNPACGLFLATRATVEAVLGEGGGRRPPVTLAMGDGVNDTLSWTDVYVRTVRPIGGIDGEEVYLLPIADGRLPGIVTNQAGWTVSDPNFPGWATAPEGDAPQWVEWSQVAAGIQFGGADAYPPADLSVFGSIDVGNVHLRGPDEIRQIIADNTGHIYVPKPPGVGGGQQPNEGPFIDFQAGESRRTANANFTVSAGFDPREVSDDEQALPVIAAMHVPICDQWTGRCYAATAVNGQVGNAADGAKPRFMAFGNTMRLIYRSTFVDQPDGTKAYDKFGDGAINEVELRNAAVLLAYDRARRLGMAQSLALAGLVPARHHHGTAAIEWRHTPWGCITAIEPVEETSLPAEYRHQTRSARRPIPAVFPAEYRRKELPDGGADMFRGPFDSPYGKFVPSWPLIGQNGAQGTDFISGPYLAHVMRAGQIGVSAVLEQKLPEEEPAP